MALPTVSSTASAESGFSMKWNAPIFVARTASVQRGAAAHHDDGQRGVCGVQRRQDLETAGARQRQVEQHASGSSSAMATSASSPLAALLVA
jgi:hypothetical protein